MPATPTFLQFEFELYSGSGLEEAEAALFEAGATSVTLEDAADHPILEPPPGVTPLWPAVRIKALFEGSADSAAIEELLQQRVGAPLAGRFATLENRVWEREWLKDFKPMRFGRRLWICPGGQRPPPVSALPRDATNVRADDGAWDGAWVEIELDPGLAFGTGTHPTTALCLEWLDGAEVAGKSVIDYGCGSGILAVAALKLGARTVLGVDIDPQALLASRANAERNGVERCLELRLADAGTEPSPTNARPAMQAEAATAASPVNASSLDPKPAVDSEAAADIVLANILAEPLQALAATLASLTVPGGHVVLAGLLESQQEAVAACYAPWFDIAPPVTRERWTRLVGVRRSDRLKDRNLC